MANANKSSTSYFWIAVVDEELEPCTLHATEVAAKVEVARLLRETVRSVRLAKVYREGGQLIEVGS